MNFTRLRGIVVLFVLITGLLGAGCAGGGCPSGKCGLPSPEKSKIGVSPYCGRYIEGGHGWR
jgi:hypothetical protein